MKTFEQHNSSNKYYAIKWLNLITNVFVDAEGNFENLEEVEEFLGFKILDDLSVYNKEYKIVKIEEETITEEELKLWHETKKYNL